MPSVSKKQHNLMAAVAHNPKFAKKVGIPQSVGEEFNKADKGKQFKRGGEMAESKKMVKKEVAFMKAKGAPKSMLKHEKAEAGMKKGGMAKSCMKEGGKVAGMKAGGVEKELPTAKDLGSMNMKKGGRVKCMAGGGYVRAADGVTKKGKTKGKII
jgi:hypothetical protein